MKAPSVFHLNHLLMFFMLIRYNQSQNSLPVVLPRDIMLEGTEMTTGVTSTHGRLEQFGDISPIDVHSVKPSATMMSKV